MNNKRFINEWICLWETKRLTDDFQSVLKYIENHIPTCIFETFQVLFPTEKWFLQLQSCFIRWYKNKWSIKLWLLCIHYGSCFDFIAFVMSWHLYRPSDRVCGCRTAQFDQSRTIPYNFRKSAKSRTIWKDLVKNLIKLVFPSIAKV